MTAREPTDAVGKRLWALEQGYCGESEHVDDLITLAWNLYHENARLRAALEMNMGVILRSPLKGKEARDAIVAASYALTPASAPPTP